jgi:glycosyltransferase involved in cell wall biosynthesis
MRILFIVPYVPNLVRVRPYNLIRYLAERGHEVTVLTLQSHESETADVAELAKLAHHVVALPLPKWRSFWNCVWVLPSSRPLQSVFCWQPALAREMMELVTGQNGRAPYDVIHVEHLRGVRYGLQLKEMGTAVPVVWDSVDCISFLFEQAVAQSKSSFGRFITRLDLNRTRQLESRVVDVFDQVLVTSAMDREAFIGLRPSGTPEPPIAVLPNGVDLETFKPDTTVPRNRATIVVSGKMSYHANITMVLHLAEAIMPLVWEQRPDAKLLIVGKDPAPALQKLAEHPNVTVTGTVPAIVPYLQQATLCVAPIPYGAGIQNKVLEAMACATPVVVSPQAAKAFAANPQQDFLVASTPADFATQILRLLNDVDFQRSLGEQGYHFVKAHHDWRQTTIQLEKIYQTLTNITP